MFHYCPVKTFDRLIFCSQASFNHSLFEFYDGNKLVLTEYGERQLEEQLQFSQTIFKLMQQDDNVPDRNLIRRLNLPQM